jgi:hypothetical protein
MRMIASGPVIPVFSRRLSMAAECGFCAVFKDRGEALRRPVPAYIGCAIVGTSRGDRRTPVSQNSTACPASFAVCAPRGSK